ncbi:MAG: hypothetical protein OXF79_21615, partial [Chloroflexi bacterium]|nr:hypothetical protein [Chloroflexota bacterium]
RCAGQPDDGSGRKLAVRINAERIGRKTAGLSRSPGPTRHYTLLGIKGFAFAIPTALVALDQTDGLAVCESLNRALGLDRAAWTALAARCLRTGAGGMNGSTLH